MSSVFKTFWSRVPINVNVLSKIWTHEQSTKYLPCYKHSEIMPSKWLTVLPTVISKMCPDEQEELSFEVATGEAPLVLSDILKGFIGCKVRTLFDLWTWICTLCKVKNPPPVPVALNDPFNITTGPALAMLWLYQDLHFIVQMDGPMSNTKSNL